MTTLTERYIAETVKSLPPGLQEDVRGELGASIADAVEDRVAQGESAEAAERAVLTDLGDPGVLAAGYADRPLQLIGPRYFLTWWRLLKLLWAIVPACVVGAVILGQSLAGAGIGEIIGQSVGVGITVAVHLAFWTTLVFFVLERTGADTGTVWSVDHLPDPQEVRAGRGDLIASLVLVGVFAGALVWDALRGTVFFGGEWIHFLNPGLWPWWTGLLLVILAAEAALAIAVFAHGRWTRTFAAVNTALAVAVLSLALTGLGRGVLFDPRLAEVLAAEAGADIPRILAILFGFVVAGVCVWDALDGWLRARRAARA